MSATASGRVFISYRRQDVRGSVGRLYDRLAARFGDAQVFMDVDTIGPGVEFAKIITQAVSSCEVLLVVIGPRWLSATDENGRRRLDDPDDLVRLEIAAALERDVRVIPILVEDGAMPHRQELPEDLAGLASRNAYRVQHESFRSDTDRLLAAIESILRPPAAAGLVAPASSAIVRSVPSAVDPTGPASVISTSEPAPEQGTRAGQVWNIPGPVRSFTGRDTQLAELRDQLETGQRTAPIPVIALYGMGGIGKTQLARAYAHRHRNQYQLGWWILAESPLTTATALAELAVRLGASAELPQPQQLTYAREALAERDRWLLVFDNATDPAALEPFLPAAGTGHVLVTSRSSAWHGLADPIPVELLPLDAAAKLLRQRTGDPDQPAAEALAEELGRLPLALEQAAAYASRQQLSLAGYLAVFRTRRAELLARGQPLAYQGTVDAAYTLALEQLGQADPAAAQLLALCALLAPDEIPVGWLLDQPQLLPSPLAEAAHDPLRRSEVTGALYQAALLTPDVEDSVRLHRLIQAVTLEHLPDHDRHELVERAVVLLAALFPEQPHDPAAWPVCAQLLSHGYALVEHAHQQQLANAALGTLLHRMGVYVWARGMGLARARELHEQALAMRRQVFAGDHPDLARSLANVAIVLADLGDYAGARELDEQALAMYQRLYTTDHPDIARSLSSLGVTLEDLGEYARARELHEQAVAMIQRLHEGDHPEVANYVSNLADVLRALGDLGRARELHEQALAMLQRLNAGDHPLTAYVLDSLAEDLRGLGDYGGARDLDEQALAMRRRLYAGDNPGIARSLNNLAEDLYGLGDYAGARELDEQALAMFQQLYTTDHPDIARSLNNVAEDLRGLGDYAGARDLHEQALAMFQQLAGRDIATA